MNADRDEFDEVLRGAQRGQDASFAVLWRRYQPRLLRYLRVAVRNADAEDVASVVWSDVARSLARFSGDEGQFRAWLFTIARRRVLDHRRAAARRPVTRSLGRTEGSAVDPPDSTGEVAAIAELRWSTDAALAMLRSLKPIQAEVLALRVIVGLGVDEVAQLVHKSPGAVRVIAHRALRELAVLIESPDADPPRDL